jgi:hypothetical protein
MEEVPNPDQSAYQSMIVIMARCPRLAPARVFDWDIVADHANEEIITFLRNSPAFMAAPSFRA